MRQVPTIEQRGNRTLVTGSRSSLDYTAAALSAIEAANTLMQSHFRKVQRHKWDMDFLNQIGGERPGDDDPRNQVRFDEIQARIPLCPLEVLATYAAVTGVQSIETWSPGTAWIPSLSVNLDDTDPFYGQVTIIFATDPAGPSVGDVEAERAVAFSRLQSKFRAARDAGVIVNGVRIETTPQAQSEIKSLRDYLAGQPAGATQTFRTRSGATVTADLAVAEAILAAVEERISTVWANDAALGQQIEAASTIIEIRTIDLNGGWT